MTSADYDGGVEIKRLPAKQGIDVLIEGRVDRTLMRSNLAKPVQPRVLLARIKAITRRMHVQEATAAEGEALQFGRLRIHGLNREVTLGDRRIELSPAEFDLLWLLASNAGKVMQRHDILKSLRGLHYSGADRSVDARLYRLRRRFGADKEASWKIKTVRPHGYMFCQEPW